jgi:hypothetical protein
MAQTHHLSQKAFDRLKAEHDELTTVGRVDIARMLVGGRVLGVVLVLGVLVGA